MPKAKIPSRSDRGPTRLPLRLKRRKETERGSWPPYLLDSDAALLWEKIHDRLATLEFQEILTNSIASENAFRHRILEEAKNNTDRLISELSIELAMARKKEITKEIQELAVAAGLVQ
jgi:F0F1-type ATP synthase gamma subunit